MSQVRAKHRKAILSICREHGFDLEKVTSIYSKVIDLLLKVITEEKTKVMLVEAMKSIGRGQEYLTELLDLVSGKKLTPKQGSLIDLHLYLVAVEGYFMEIVDSIIFIFIRNHHDIYDPHRMRFAKSYREVEKMSSFVKLQFLEEHELELIAHAYNRKLRNCIAHLRYIVRDDGTVINTETEREIEKKDVRKIVYDLVGIGGIVLHLFAEAFGVSA